MGYPAGPSGNHWSPYKWKEEAEESVSGVKWWEKDSTRLLLALKMEGPRAKEFGQLLGAGKLGSPLEPPERKTALSTP